MLFKNLKQLIVDVQSRKRDHDLIENVTSKIEYLYELYPYYCAIQEMVTPIVYHSVLKYQQYSKRQRALNVFQEGIYPAHHSENYNKSNINHLLSIIYQQPEVEKEKEESTSDKYLYILEGITSNEIIEACNTVKNGVIYLNCLDSHCLNHCESVDTLVGEGKDEDGAEEEEDEEKDDTFSTIYSMLSKSMCLSDEYNSHNKYCSWLLEKVVGESECCTKEVDKPIPIQVRNMLNLLDEASENYKINNLKSPVLIIDNFDFLISNDLPSLHLLLEYSYLHSKLGHLIIIFIINQQQQQQQQHHHYNIQVDNDYITTDTEMININDIIRSSSNSSISSSSNSIEYLKSNIKHPFTHHRY